MYKRSESWPKFQKRFWGHSLLPQVGFQIKLIGMDKWTVTSPSLVRYSPNIFQTSVYSTLIEQITVWHHRTETSSYISRHVTLLCAHLHFIFLNNLFSLCEWQFQGCQLQWRFSSEYKIFISEGWNFHPSEIKISSWKAQIPYHY